MTERVGGDDRAFPVVSTGVNPRVALATSMHASPGVYAVLVGSGMSTAAGIPTGWQVVQDLIRKVAVVEGVDLQEIGATPEQWWSSQGRLEPKYDKLLAELATTDAARRALLREYFEVRQGQKGLISPTPAHEALAQLCASGRVRLILTTNFDHLIEHALDAAGVPVQVISSSSSIKGMTPLVHAPTTLIKLHGDYTMPGLRNTPEELSKYSPEINRLLTKAFDEFGLLVIGWSADYDIALINVLTKVSSRRYPMFWAIHNGRMTEPAKRLASLRSASIIDTNGADEFLTNFVQSLDRLDRIAIRRGKPTPLRIYNFSPHPASTPSGWAFIPLLQLRAVAMIGPATADECGILRTKNREAVMGALETAHVTTRLRRLAEAPAASAIPNMPISNSSGGMLPSETWNHTPGGYQTGESASYRLGGDATWGISALVETTFPPANRSGSVLVTFDIGISLGRSMGLGEMAMLLRDALLASSLAIPESIADLLPSDAQVTQVEVHIQAADQDGNGKNRPNSLLERVDLSCLGKSTRAVGPSLGFAARVSTPLSEREVTELVVQAIEYMALSAGYVDPNLGLAMLREELGLATVVTTN